MPGDVRLAFFGSYPWSALLLAALWEAPHIHIARVATVPDRPQAGFTNPVTRFCTKRGAQDRLFVLDDLTGGEAADVFSGKALDCVLSVAYPRRIPQSLLGLFPLGGVNLHPSLLPRWRGPDPVRRAMLAGDVSVGVSLHVLEHEFDAGDILWQEDIAVRSEETCADILDHLGRMAGRALPAVLSGYASGDIIPRPQVGEPTYAAPIEDAERWVLPGMRLEEANRLIGALVPYRPARYAVQGTTFELLSFLERTESAGGLEVRLSDGTFYCNEARASG